MTSPPSSPNRRRRRVVAAIAVLLMASLCTWWYWPRGDARFVGKWAVQSPTGSLAVLTFSANGMATNFTEGFLVRYPWRVEGDRLICGWRVAGPVLPAAEWLEMKWFGLTGTRTPWER